MTPDGRRHPTPRAPDPANRIPLVYAICGNDGDGSIMLEGDRWSTDFVVGFELGKIWVMANAVAACDRGFDVGLHDSVIEDAAEMLFRISEALRVTITETENNMGFAKLRIEPMEDD